MWLRKRFNAAILHFAHKILVVFFSYTAQRNGLGRQSAKRMPAVFSRALSGLVVTVLKGVPDA